MTVPLLISSAATQIFWLALNYLVTVDAGCRQIQENRRVMKYKRVTMQQTKAKPNGYMWQTEDI